MDYEPLRWLTLKPYVNYQTRNSNIIGGNFNATIYGILAGLIPPVAKKETAVAQVAAKPVRIQ